MKTNWSLSEIYPSFNSSEFLVGLDCLNEIINRLKKFCNTAFSLEAPNGDTVEEYIAIQTELGETASRLADYCGLLLSVDADNRDAMKHMETIENALTETVIPKTKFYEYLKSIEDYDLASIINKSDALKRHEFYIKEAKQNSKYLLSEGEENIISKLETTGSSAWIKFQENVMSTLTVDIEVNGEKKRLPFASIRNMAYDKDPDTRKTAYIAELEACERVAKQCAAALNGIKGEVITICGLRGYESPLEMTLIDSRMDSDILNALISAIRENAEMFTEYFKKKAALLGKDKLPFYDLFAPVGNASLSFSYEQAADFVIKQFTDFSPSLGAYAEKAITKNWIDVYPKEGKRGGAFCQNLHYLKESRFLLNFTGSFSDVLTLAHELGHGYHGYCLENETHLNSNYPMPIAETASTLCETIVINAALKNANSEEILEILENDISSSAQVTIDILSRFIFESEVFEKRKNSSLTEKELCQIMLSAQKEAYKNGLDQDNLHKYMWVVKPHYYSAYTNFYNFPYAFGLLFSKGLYASYIDKGDGFIGTIDKMLASSGRANMRDVAAIAGLDLTGGQFWQSSFDIIRKELDMFFKAASNVNTVSDTSFR